MDVKSNSGPELPRPVSQNSDPVSRSYELGSPNSELSKEIDNVKPELEPLQNQAVNAASSSTASTQVQIDDSNGPSNSKVGSDEVNSDEDVIKKFWVDKAKKIIKDTSGDPRIRSNKLASFKADYVGVRFNKVLKVSKEES